MASENPSYGQQLTTTKINEIVVSADTPAYEAFLAQHRGRMWIDSSVAARPVIRLLSTSTPAFTRHLTPAPVTQYATALGEVTLVGASGAAADAFTMSGLLIGGPRLARLRFQFSASGSAPQFGLKINGVSVLTPSGSAGIFTVNPPATMENGFVEFFFPPRWPSAVTGTYYVGVKAGFKATADGLLTSTGTEGITFSTPAGDEAFITALAVQWYNTTNGTTRIRNAALWGI